METSILPGFRFHPTDEELVGFYLKRRVQNKPALTELITQIDIYKHDPWDLPICSKLFVGEKERYFVCRRRRKYRNSIRSNRVTGSGFWKATGIDKPIYCSIKQEYSSANNCDIIGLKKSLVYYKGSAGKGVKTDWMMHEFRLPSSLNSSSNNPHITISKHEAEIWTLCRIFERAGASKRSELAINTRKNTQIQSNPTCTTTNSELMKDFQAYPVQKMNEMGIDNSHIVDENTFNTGVEHVNAASSLMITSNPDFQRSNLGCSFSTGIGNFDELRAVVDSAIGSSLDHSLTDSIFMRY